MKGGIWIYGDLRNVRRWADSLKVATKAMVFARDAGVGASLVLMGPGKEPRGDEIGDFGTFVGIEDAARQASAIGVEAVYILEHPGLAVPRADVHADALAGFVSERRPWLVLIPLNDFGREMAAVCAQRCRAGVIADCAELSLKTGAFVGRCPAWGGQIMADITLAEGWPAAFVTVQPQGVDIPSPTAVEAGIEIIRIENVNAPGNARLVSRMLEPVESRRLEDARTVVVGGAGVGDMNGFGMVRELAAALGGEVGATRPPVLNRWVGEDRLIGQTGKSIRPRLLISVGTSGAVQYTAGIMEAETIVAVDRDSSAPVFQVADIGIVSDARVFLPLLNRRVKQMAMGRMAKAAWDAGTGERMAPGGLGVMVRRLREARDWSREDLAKATGQSTGFVESVESDSVTPPVGFILNMARAMQVDPGTFLHKETQEAIRDRRAQAYFQRTQAYSYTTLTPEASNSHLRAFMVTIEAHRDHKPLAYKHEGEEFIFVMEGELELMLGGEARRLVSGESIHFDSNVPHKLKSLSGNPTRCLVVLYTL